MSFIGLMAQTLNVASPDGKLQVNIVCQNGQACYSVNYDGKNMVTPSALGLLHQRPKAERQQGESGEQELHHDTYQDFFFSLRS